MKLRNLPLRLVTGAFILNSGLEKGGADEQTAQGLHGMATGTYPALASMKPTDFLRLLSVSEVALGAALLAPVVPPVVAGTALTGFSAGLLGLYAKTPGLRQPGSIKPTPDGLGIAKDVWMLGIGVSLVLGGLRDRRTA